MRRAVSGGVLRAVADRFARPQALRRDDTADEPHRRPHRERRRERRRRNTVEQQARTHGIEPDAGVAEQGGAVGGVPADAGNADAVERSQRVCEGRALRVHERVLGVFRGREVRVDAVEPQVRTDQQLAQGSSQVVMPEAEPVHAGVDLQVVADPRPTPRGFRFDGPCRGRRRDRRHQVVLEQPAEIADAQRAEHEDGGAHPRRTQRDRLFDVGTRDHPRPGALERERHGNGAVPVGVGLDDGDDGGRRAFNRFSGQKGGDGTVVGLDSGQIDQGDGGANQCCIREFGRRNAEFGIKADFGIRSSECSSSSVQR